MVCSGITLDGNIVTVEYDVADGTRGASYGNPYTAEDIVDSIGAGCTKQGRSYYIPYRVDIQGLSTYFAITYGTLIEIDTAEAYSFYVYAGVNFKCYYNVTGREQGGGVIKDTQSRRCSFYAGDIEHLTLINVLYFVIYNCTISIMYLDYVYGISIINSQVEDMIISKTGSFGIYSVSNSTLNRITFKECTYAIKLLSLSIEVSNIKCIDNTYDIALMVNNAICSVILIDSEIDTDKILISPSGTTSGTKSIYLRTTFNATIENGNGGDLTIEDKDGNVAYFETLSSDDMTEQIITYYDRVTIGDGGTGIESDTITEYQPFTLKITKGGYQDLEITGITVEAGHPTNIFGKMEEISLVSEALSGELSSEGELTGELQDEGELIGELND